MSCCPPSAWGELKNPSYKSKGVVEEFEGLRFYRSGSSHKCIIWNYDVFGFNGGRTQQMVDFIADHGYMVIIPDYYAGKMINPMTSAREELVAFVKNETDWEANLKATWETKIKPYAVNHGAKTFGAIGTCWGTYMVVRLSSYMDFKAGISMHPSHTAICAMLGLNEENLLKEIKCPQMFMPAGDDNENVKIGGLGQKVLGDGVEIIEFPDMKHGWTVKGDRSEPEVERDVMKAFNFAITFFGKYLH